MTPPPRPPARSRAAGVVAEGPGAPKVLNPRVRLCEDSPESPSTVPRARTAAWEGTQCRSEGTEQRCPPWAKAQDPAPWNPASRAASIPVPHARRCLPPPPASLGANQGRALLTESPHGPMNRASCGQHSHFPGERMRLQESKSSGCLRSPRRRARARRESRSASRATLSATAGDGGQLCSLDSSLT